MYFSWATFIGKKQWPKKQEKTEEFYVTFSKSKFKINFTLK